MPLHREGSRLVLHLKRTLLKFRSLLREQGYPSKIHLDRFPNYLSPAAAGEPRVDGEINPTEKSQPASGCCSAETGKYFYHLKICSFWKQHREFPLVLWSHAYIHVSEHPWPVWTTGTFWIWKLWNFSCSLSLNLISLLSLETHWRSSCSSSRDRHVTQPGHVCCVNAALGYIVTTFNGGCYHGY